MYLMTILWGKTTEGFHRRLRNTVLEIIKEIPFNATPLDILKFLSLHGLERVKAGGLWNTVLEVMKIVVKNLISVHSPLQKYGVPSMDIVNILVHRLGLKEDDHELFVELLRKAESSKH